MCTDGKNLDYNPDFVNTLSPDELLGVIAHEVMHNALGHHVRRGQREPERWNESADIALNPLLVEAGFALPAGCLMPGEGRYQHLPRGLSAEEYYDLLPPRGGGANSEQQGVLDPGQCGAVTEPNGGSPATLASAEAEGKVAVAQAAQLARQRGAFPAGLARLVEEALQPKTSVEEVLREFVSRQARSDFTWCPPNRRLMAQGRYLPGLRSEELGEVVLAVDCSGSIDQETLDLFAGVVQRILEVLEVKLTILYHDSKVTHVQDWHSSDGDIRFEPHGGGGTDHRPVFAWIDERGQEPTCLVCLTDMASRFPKTVPAYPVLWAAVGAANPQGPFGQVVVVDN